MESFYVWIWEDFKNILLEKESKVYNNVYYIIFRV